MKLFNKYSPKELLEMSIACGKRFPLTIAFIVMLTATLLAIVEKDGAIVSEKFTFFCVYYLSTGALLSFSLHLWGEEVHRLTVKISVQIVLHGLWLVGAIYLAGQFGQNLDISLIWGHLAGVTLTFISIFILSFFRDKNDIASWNFAIQVMLSFMMVVFVGLLLSGGLDLLLLSFDKLFDINISRKIYTDVFVICLSLLAPLLFLELIPRGEEKHDTRPTEVNRFGHVVIHFLFMPLLGAYLLTLYVYAFKIMVAWTLPCGWVSWLVTASMLAMVLIIVLIYPIQFADGQRLDKQTLRFLPLIVLPLLLLMTIGIIRRLNDYGITISRLYLLTFNIWCYIVCIGLFLKRSRRINWVPASFGLIFFLVSVGPQSFANVTRRALLKEVTSEMNKSKIRQRPMNADVYQLWMARIDTITANRMNDKLEYLQSTFGDSVTSNLVAFPVFSNRTAVDDSDSATANIASGDGQTTLQWTGSVSSPIQLPIGYTKVLSVNDTPKCEGAYTAQTAYLSFSIPYSEQNKDRKIEFKLSTAKMRQLNGSTGEKQWMVYAPDACLYVLNFNVYTIDEGGVGGSVSGLMFLK
jgi:hypothetical protein